MGGGTQLINQLVAGPRLDVVLTDPTTKQPHYQ
jgi:hypothetical protein